MTEGGAQGVTVALLGPLEVEVGGHPIPPPAPKERALLATLALRPGRSLNTGDLADACWAGHPPASARKSIQVIVSRLRAQFEQAGVEDGRALLVTSGTGYQLAVDPDRVDAHRFERLVGAGRHALDEGDAAGAVEMLDEALALWRSDPVPDLVDSAAGQAESARLAELRLGAVEERVEAGLALGNHARLAPEIEAALATEPLRERLWRQLMLALYRSGRQADALRAYQRARSMLVDELGIEPGPELRRLEAEIVAQEPGLDYVPPRRGSPDGEAARGVPASRPVVADGGEGTADANDEAARPEQPDPAAQVGWARRLRRHRFVGRVDERARLERAWRNAAQWGVTTAVVTGEEGVGKTRLLAEAAVTIADEGGLVLAGRCEDRAALPFLAIRRALDRWAEHGVSGAAGWTGYAAALPGLSPGLADRLGIEAPPPPDDPYAVAMGLAAVARREGAEGPPVVLAIEDAHFARDETLRVVRHLVEGDGELPLLVVLTCRDAEGRARPELLDLLADLHRLPGHERIALTGLSGEEGVELLADRLGRPVDDGSRLALATLAQEAAGNPLYLLALARHVIDAGVVGADAGWPTAGIGGIGLPDSVRELVLRRSRLLDEGDQAVLGIAAVAGQVFDVGTVAAAADQEEEAVVAAVDRAGAAGLVREADDEAGRYRFASAVVRLALYEEQSLARRSQLHQRLGEALADRGVTPSGGAGSVSEVADHFALARGRPEDRSGDHAVRGGPGRDDAFGRDRYVSAYEAAVERMGAEAAVGDAERWCRLLLGLAESRWRSGDLAAAHELFERAATEARHVGRPDLLTQAAAGAARVVVRLGVAHPSVITLLREARDNLEPDDPLQDEVRSALVPELVWAGRWREAVEVSNSVG